MKRTIAILLVLCLCFGLCACGGAQKAEETKPSEETTIPSTEASTEAVVEEDPVWSLAATVDEFGDVTEDSDMVMQSSFVGTFKNSATVDGELHGQVFILYNEKCTRANIGFKLFEYGEFPVICNDSDSILLKTKVGNTVTEYSNVMPSYTDQGTLFVGLLDTMFDYDGNQIIDILCNGNDIKCIFYINNSEYHFTLESDNFAELYKEPGVGKVQIPGAFVGTWEFSSGDATVFSRLTSDGKEQADTNTIDIELEAETIYNGNPVYLIVTSDTGDRDMWGVTFSLDYVMDNTHINTETGYAEERSVELKEDKTLVLTVKYYQGEAGMSYDELESKLDDESSNVTAVCEFKQVVQ